MIRTLPTATFCALLFLAVPVCALASTYTVTRENASSTKLDVRATLHIDGTELQMEQSWPGDVPSVGDNGWPALVRDLRVADASGKSLSFRGNGPAGWLLNAPYKGTLTLAYTVDYTEAAAANWPAPREAAFADKDNFTFSGKSLFITTPQSTRATVRFNLPRGWQAVAPWPQLGRDRFQPASSDDLRGNILVLTRAAPSIVNAGGFRVVITPMGKWLAVRKSIERIVRGIIPVYAGMMGARPDAYSIVLLPISDTGGESYRNSFAFNVVDPPTDADSSVWGHTIAHEIFHYWNGWRLRGTDYAGSQWFQEGFTDYAADIAMAASGLMDERAFLTRIENNIARYRRLTTTLEAPGSRKGPPLYGGGALVALCWDIQILNATRGRRSIADFLRKTWQRSENGKRSYAWSDLKASLDEVAPHDWEAFYQAHVRGNEKLPLDSTLALAGLTIRKNADGSEIVEVNPAASASARSLLRALMTRR